MKNVPDAETPGIVFVFGAFSERRVDQRAVHGVDFGIEHHPNASDYAEEMQEIVFQSVMAFARTGSPATSLLPAWPACTKEEEHTMVLDEHSRCLTNFDHALIPAAGRILSPVFERIMKDLSGQTQH